MQADTPDTSQYVFMCKHTYPLLYLPSFPCTYPPSPVPTLLPLFMHAHVHPCVYLHAHTHAHPHPLTCMLACTHTHTHTHIQEECRRELEARRREFEEQENINSPERASTNGSIDSFLSRLALLRPVCRSDLDSYHAPPKALVIDGTSLEFALHSDVKKLFLYIASRCRSVICCRAAPLQKVRAYICHMYS